MEPTIGSLKIVDPVETRFSVLYKQKGRIGLEVLPGFPMDDIAGSFYKFSKRDMFRRHSTYVDPHEGEPNVVRWKPGSDSFSAAYHTLKNAMAEDIVAIARRRGIDPVRYGNMLVQQALLNELEILIATMVRNTANVTQYIDLSSDPTTQFDDYTNSKPRVIFKNARKTLKYRRPNRAIVPYDVMETLMIHPDCLAAFQYVDGGVLSEEQIARILKVEKVLVPDCMEDTGDDVDADPTLEQIWGTDILFYYVDPTITLETLTFGWSPYYKMPGTAGLIEGMEGGLPWRVRRYRSDSKGSGGSDNFQTEGWFDHKLTCADLGYLIKNAISA